MSNASTTPAGRMRAEDTICAIARLRALQCTMHDGPCTRRTGESHLVRMRSDLESGLLLVVGQPRRRERLARTRHAQARTQVVHPLAPVAAQFAARAVRYLVIGISGASFYAPSGQAVFSTEDVDLFLPLDFLPLDSDNRSRQAAENYSRKAAMDGKVSRADTSFPPLRLR